MESFGSEVGQKMRSAVKAKLLELGTGGSAGYIDDELPDYVMIMVANKRSKQQMIADLNLFLGTQTELFVTWLHEVLQKLQAVTVPAASIATVQKKRKTSNHKEDPVAANLTKKEKKTAKKEKRTANKNKNTQESAESKISGDSILVPAIPSISEVFAGEFLEKAKKTFEIDANLSLKTQKHRKKSPSVSDTPRKLNNEMTTVSTNEFDIPTISQISTGSLATNIIALENSDNKREKDLAELADIQKKIYAAKKQLKTLEESEDEDFLNIKEDGSGEDFDEVGDLVKKQQQLEQQRQSEKPPGSRPKSPIVFDRQEKRVDESNDGRVETRSGPEGPIRPPRIHVGEQSSKRETGFLMNRESQRPSERDTDENSRSRFRDYERERERDKERDRDRERERRDRDRERENASKKRSVHERLGVKSMKNGNSMGANQSTRRAEKELYVPAFRRKEVEQEQRGRNRDVRSPIENISRQRSTPRSIPTSIEKKRRTERDDRSPTLDVSPPPRQRVVSRVIVAPPSKPEQESSDDNNDKPVSSVITIKPRPPVSPSKQACKNLLLRAVAEAQRSTILAKPKKEPASVGRSRSPLENNTKYFTKSYRERLKRKSVSSALFHRSTQNLVIEVDATSSIQRKRRRRDESIERQNLGEIIDNSQANDDEDEYIPGIQIVDPGESDLDFAYVPQSIHCIDMEAADDFVESVENHREMSVEAIVEDDDNDDNNSENKTQFVVTMNEDNPDSQYVSSKSRQNGVENKVTLQPLVTVAVTSKYRYSRERNKSDLKNRFKVKSIAKLSPASSAISVADRDSANSSPSCHTPPRPSSVTKRTELIDVYRKPKEFRKIIIQNDSDDDEAVKSIKDGNKSHEIKSSPLKVSPDDSKQAKKQLNRSMTPPLPSNHNNHMNNNQKQSIKSDIKNNSSLSEKRKRTPIKFDLAAEAAAGNAKNGNDCPTKRQRSKSKERDSIPQSEDFHSNCDIKISKQNVATDDIKQKISIRNAEAKKYENIPSLSSVAIDSSAIKGPKLKERCKYHPTCTKDNCEFYHPSTPCKSFPNCKFANKCLYTHPKCKFDLTCTKINCNFSHSAATQSGAPPLSSHVVPVQNYKSISATTPALPMCKYYPNCSKPLCTFYHPKMCRFGKNCINKLECNYYHHELQSSNKFKWVASIG